MYGSRIIGLVCKGETVGEIGEVDEKGEKELAVVVGQHQVRQGMTHDTWIQLCEGHKDVHCSCCICGCTVHTSFVFMATTFSMQTAGSVS